MQIPLQAEAPNDFIQRAAGILESGDTHIYFDTSFLMWLVTLGHQSRSQFISWTASIGAKVHVPIWAMHEFYRHHTAGTLRKRLGRHSEKLLKAARSFQREVQAYRDDSLFTIHSTASYTHSVNDLVDRLAEVTEAAKSWDYEKSAAEILAWMNAHSCATDTVFKRAETLLHYGEARYTQDIPPGFLDRRKQDKPNKGSNRYGDLLFWEEIIAHSSMQRASAVMVFTCDRKADWFMDLGEVEDQAWKRLRDRWKPVPRPHPTLAVELKVRAGVNELVFLDELYFGAVLWKTKRQTHERLAAIAINIDPTRFAEAEKPRRSINERALKRKDNATIGVSQAMKVVREVHIQADGAVADLLAVLEASAPDVDNFVTQFTSSDLASLTIEQSAVFARSLHDGALEGPGPSRVLATAVLDILDQFEANQAAGLYAGFVYSAYFDGQLPRALPQSPLLDEIFAWQYDTAFQKIIQAFTRHAKAARSPALYLPDGKMNRHIIRVDHDSSQNQDPAVLQQIFYDEMGLLLDGEAWEEATIIAAVGSSQATVEQLVCLVCKRFGLPRSLVDVEGCDVHEMRLVPERFGFTTFDRFQMDSAAPIQDVLVELDDGDVDLIVPDDNDDELFDQEEDE